MNWCENVKESDQLKLETEPTREISRIRIKTKTQITESENKIKYIK